MSTSPRVIFDFIILAIIYRVFFYTKWKTMSKKKFILHNLFYVYISLVIYLTLMPIITSIPFIFNHEYVSMYLLPFDDYFQQNGDATFQIIINIIMFIPLGFTLPMLKKRGFINVLLISFLFTLSIEILQPLLNSFRISDITDVITNTTGGVVGYILYLCLKPLLNKTVFKEDNI